MDRPDPTPHPPPHPPLDPALALANRPAGESPRAIAYHTAGHRHGPILRLMSPADLGQVLKPFVFLDLFDLGGTTFQGFSMHPHSGIATLTYMLSGDSNYEDSTGKQGLLKGGGVEWMQAGGGVWHNATPAGSEPARGFQLWVALPPALENAAAQSHYIAPEQIPVEGPAQVLLGQYGSVRSAVPSDLPITYLAVRLQAGERWRFEPPQGQTLAWFAVGEGAVETAALTRAGEMAVFDNAASGIDFHARADSLFVVGSAVPHPHELVMGRYSVHTSAEALRTGEAAIARIGHQLRAEGRR